MKYTYKIYEKETDKIYELEIHQIINHIKNNILYTYYKIIDNEKILINNKIILNCEFICHRINKIDELNNINEQFGVELDIRDDHKSNKLILSHDPFLEGEYFEDYLIKYNKNIMILNIKSERIELECLKLLEKYNIKKYFFLDSSFPMIYLLNNQYNDNNIACRISEYEPIESFLYNKDFYKYIWIDCFSKFPLNNEIYEIIKKENKKICIVSPELQKQPEKVKEYRDNIIFNNIIPDLICCKIYNIINWI